MTVFEFLEETKQLPRKVTVNRSKTSSYLFYLTVRHYGQKLGLGVKCHSYQKVLAQLVKGSIEEHHLFQKYHIYALEGFSRQFVDQLKVPAGNYIVAETEDGELEAEPYSYKTKRGILRALDQQLSLQLSLRELLKMEWADLESYEEIEVVLRRAKVLGWTEEQIAQYLGAKERVNILTALKRGMSKDLLEMKENFGAQGVVDFLIRLLAQLIEFSAMRHMGMDQNRVAREMEIGRRRAEELEEASKMITQEEIKVLVKRTIEIDLLKGSRDLAAELLLLNSGVGVRR